MSTYKVEVLEVEKTLLGEGPHWDAESQTLYFVDIFGSQVRSYHPETGKSSKVTIDSSGCLGQDGVSFVIPVAGKPNEFIIGHGRSLKRLEWDLVSERPTKVTTVYDADDAHNLAGRFNDAKCDSAGRLWSGTMAIYNPTPSPEERTAGILHKLDTNGTVTKHARDLGCSNGLTWSPDNKTFYFIDSYTRRVDAFDYNHEAGTVSNQRAAFDFEKENETGIPDGMTVDVNGNLWVACFYGSKVIQIDPNSGKVIGRIELPARDITSVTFGGPNLDVMYVTSSRFKNSPGEEFTDADGGLFKVTNVGTKGLSPGIPYGGKF